MISCEARQEAVSMLRGRDGCANKDLSPGVSKLSDKVSSYQLLPMAINHTSESMQASLTSCPDGQNVCPFKSRDKQLAT